MLTSFRKCLPVAKSFFKPVTTLRKVTEAIIHSSNNFKGYVFRGLSIIESTSFITNR